MPDKPNFILVPYDDEDQGTSRSALSFVGRIRSLVTPTIAALPFRPAASAIPVLDTTASPPGRPRLVFGFDATASREPAWEAARHVTDALVRALPGELDMALAVHGGSVLHTFTEFTPNPNTLRDWAASIT